MEIRVDDKNLISDIVKKYSGMIMRIAFQNAKILEEAEDIMQEVFLALLKKRSFKSEEYMKAWMIRVTLNKSKDYLRSARRRNITLDKVQHILFTPAERESLEELYQLPNEDRTIIYLHYYEGYSAKEIGKIMKKTENAIFIRLNRAREKLKSLLENEEGMGNDK